MEPKVQHPSSAITTAVDEKVSLGRKDLAADNTFHPLDGGRDAWLVVLGSFLAMFSSFGIVNSYVSDGCPPLFRLQQLTLLFQGVFQDYYTTNLLPNSSSSTISLIGAIQLFLVYGLGPVVGRTFDAYGTKV